MNDTALRKGVPEEKQLLLYQGLCRNQGRAVGDIGRWSLLLRNSPRA